MKLIKVFPNDPYPLVFVIIHLHVYCNALDINHQGYDTLNLSAPDGILLSWWRTDKLTLV